MGASGEGSTRELVVNASHQGLEPRILPLPLPLLLLLLPPPPPPPPPLLALSVNLCGSGIILAVDRLHIVKKARQAHTD